MLITILEVMTFLRRINKNAKNWEKMKHYTIFPKDSWNAAQKSKNVILTTNFSTKPRASTQEIIQSRKKRKLVEIHRGSLKRIFGSIWKYRNYPNNWKRRPKSWTIKERKTNDYCGMPLLITNLEIHFLIFQTQNKSVNKIYDTAIINRRLFLSSYYL